MFRATRIKLTGWYLLIIMTVSLAFSGVIYHSSTRELERFSQAQRTRLERRADFQDKDFELLPPPPFIDRELIDETKSRILTSLIIINLGILGLAGILGYYLSGKTLAPIKEMMDEQYRFITDASHELKTPLTALRTSMEVTLRDKKLDNSEARTIVGNNLGDVIRLQKLTEGLLELSKSRNLELKATSISDVITEAIKEIEPLAEKQKIIIKVHTPTKLMVEAEPTTLARAVVTILDNAIKYSKKYGSITIATNIIGKEVVVRISDKGSGIGKDDLARVTDRFYRADKARSSSGYGLGLSIAKNIIELHNGQLKIESKLTHGTTVLIHLPYSARIQILTT